MSAEARRARIDNLIELARMSKGWSQSQLADYMGRSPGRLCPASGNPKSDFVMKLAEVLGWAPGEVLEVIWSDDKDNRLSGATDERSFDELFDDAASAHREGRFQDLLDVAQSIRDHAESADQIACAVNFEVGAWDGLGRYLNALEAAQRGLQVEDLSPRWRQRLQANLANALYTLWRLPAALGMADLLVRRDDGLESEDPEDVEFSAFLRYLRGNIHRRLMRIEKERSEDHAATALRDLTEARDAYLRLAETTGEERFNGVAKTCAGALLELRVHAGEVSAREAIGLITEDLDQVIDPASIRSGDLLESYGWLCIFGSNIALGALRGGELQQAVEIFAHKALEIADVLDNWALRERSITLQFDLHRRLVEPTGLRFDFVVEEETRNLVAGTMGRFPSFRPVGWKILNSASVSRRF